MIDGRKFSDQQINSLNEIYENVRKISTGQGDYNATGCLLDYSYFKENYKLMAIDLKKNSKHQILIQEQFNKLILQQILKKVEIQQCSLLLKKQKKLFLNFHKEP